MGARLMGYGDELMGSGMARGSQARGERVAFGDRERNRVVWSRESHLIYQGNPNIIPPGISPFAKDFATVWIPHYKGVRLYGKPRHGGWRWDYSFRAKPGEVMLTPQEVARAEEKMPRGAILIEPHVKPTAPNKRWPWERYLSISQRLQRHGLRVAQFSYGSPILAGALPVASPDFRTSIAMLALCSIYIGPEGGLHHAAAAVGTPAVVIFGGYIPPLLTGYDFHTNIAGTDEPCGNNLECAHCRKAMAKIEVDEVFYAATRILRGNRLRHGDDHVDRMACFVSSST